MNDENLECTAPGCDRAPEMPLRKTGLCSGHRYRMQRHGELGVAPIKDVPPAGATVYEIIDFNGWLITDSGCWEYQGPRFAKGYGQVKVDGTPRLIHRVMYERHKGEIPDGLLVRHDCDNPPCGNPDHLRVGTSKDNMDDMTKRGRRAYGERAGNSKLTDAQAVEIRKRLSTVPPYRGRMKIMQEFSILYGVSVSAVQGVWTRQTFKHLPGGHKWES